MTTRLRRYEFSERLADILGASRRDLRLRVTLLITGGLFAPGPRGPGSPPATADYAAELLIGVMAAPQQVQMVEAVRCYRDLQPTVVAAEAVTPGIVLGAPRDRRARSERSEDAAAPHAAVRPGPDAIARSGLARQRRGQRWHVSFSASGSAAAFRSRPSSSPPGRTAGAPSSASATSCPRARVRPPGSIPTRAARPTPVSSTACSCRSAS